MKLKTIPRLWKETLQKWYADNTFLYGAALAYYAVFSLAPVLIIAIAVVSLVFGDQAARGHIADQISDTVGPRVANAIQDMLKHTAETGSSTMATIVSVVLLITSATAVFSQLQQSLNAVWGVQVKPDRSWLATILDRFWSFAVMLGVGLLLLASLVLSTVLSAFAQFLNPNLLPGGVYLWQVGQMVISLGFITVLFAMIFKLLPDVKLAWRDVWVGAGATAVLFVIGEHLIAFYLTQSSRWISAYGAAGSLVVILLWVFYSSQIFLLGAEFTQVYASHYGRPLVDEDVAVPVTAEARALQGMAPEKHSGARVS